MCCLKNQTWKQLFLCLLQFFSSSQGNMAVPDNYNMQTLFQLSPTKPRNSIPSNLMVDLGFILTKNGKELILSLVLKSVHWSFFMVFLIWDCSFHNMAQGFISIWLLPRLLKRFVTGSVWWSYLHDPDDCLWDLGTFVILKSYCFCKERHIFYLSVFSCHANFCSCLSLLLRFSYCRTVESK